MSDLDVYVLTFNCARAPVNPSALASSFFDALPQGARLPALIAVSLQEVAPIAHSFLGGSLLDPYLDRIAATVRLATKARRASSQAYEHVVTRNLGMTALVLFALPDIADRIRVIRAAGTGVGLWAMGNKGSVGVHLTIAGGLGDEQGLEITFIAAHLAPMEDRWLRRNEDWKNIVRNTVFVEPESDQGTDESEPLLSDDDRTKHHAVGLYTVNSHVVVAGDLNYRTSDYPPGPKSHLDFPQPTRDNASPTHYSRLLARDQLGRELREGRTLHGFEEDEIAFPPTYKYSNKETDGNDYPGDAPPSWPWAQHRYPSWCDRILFLPSPNLQAPLQIHSYTSLPVQSTSDHQPVAISISIPISSLGAGHDEHLGSDGDIRRNPPFPLNPDWESQRVSARRLEVMTGSLAFLALTTQGNAVLAVLASGAVAVWYLLQ